MIHSFPEHDLNVVLSVDETSGSNTLINIKDTNSKESLSYYLSKEDLEQFIGILLHIQAKKRKQFKTR